MDKKSKIFFWAIGFLIIVSIGVTYWRIMIKKDYIIEAEVDCDPSIGACFIWECDPNSTEEGEACTGDPEEDIWYYSLAHRKAVNIPMCNPETEEDCDPFDCAEGEGDCEIITCNEENAVKYEVECSDPQIYNAEHPADEEECEEGDEECAVSEEDICEEGDDACAVDENEIEGEDVSDEEGDEEINETVNDSADEDIVEENETKNGESSTGGNTAEDLDAQPM